LKDLNRWALGWTIVWTVLGAALIAQLLLQSIPDNDTVFIAVDLAAIVFVLMRLRKSIVLINPPSGDEK
jgi:hypothetical protein